MLDTAFNVIDYPYIHPPMERDDLYDDYPSLPEYLCTRCMVVDELYRCDCGSRATLHSVPRVVTDNAGREVVIWLAEPMDEEVLPLDPATDH